MGSLSCHKVCNNNESDNDVAYVEDSKPKSSPISVSKPSSPHGFNIDKLNFCTDKDHKRIDKIELCCKDVMPVGRNGKHSDNTKVLTDFINNHMGESHGFVVSFLINRSSS